MLLSKSTKLKLNTDDTNIIGHMNHAAYKLWNICNYERKNYKQLGFEKYPDWYYQKQAHKDNLWFKSLPSQTAQEVCKQLDKSWKSYFKLCKTGGIENPQPPRFKHNGMTITYMQNGIQHNGNRIRLSLPRKLMEHMQSVYDVHKNYIYLENEIFKGMDHIKQIKIYPPVKNECKIIVIYEIPDMDFLPDNGHYLSIDLGLHNLMTCVDSLGCNSFIIGRKYLSICHYYDKKIAHVQSVWAGQQVKCGVRYPKPSKHLLRLYEKKRNHINDYLHKVTRWIANYCHTHHINTVVIGDITNIRKDNDLGTVTNQKLHALPYRKIYQMLEYKLALYHIRLVMQNEAWSSQCSPKSPVVAKEHADKKNRIMRGLYKENNLIWNADAVGAFNIMRLYLQKNNIKIPMPTESLSAPELIKVAA